MCVKCSDEEIPSNGVCVPKGVSSSNVIQGVLANDGTPFYIADIASCIAAGLGMIVYYNKQGCGKSLVQQPLQKHVASCFFATASFLSEMVLAWFVLGSGINELMLPATLMILSRFLISP